MKKSYPIKGMTCSACSSHIEKALNKTDGIKNASVSLLTNEAVIDFDDELINDQIICGIVKKCGYEVKISKKANKKNGLIASIILCVILLYVSMGSMIGLYIPKFLRSVENAWVFVLLQIILLIPIIVINNHYFKNGFKRLFKLSPNMDSLIALGSTASILYGLYAFIMIIYGLNMGNLDIVHKFHMNIYLESAGTILTLVSLGKYLEHKSEGKTTEEITKLVDLTPKIANVIMNEKIIPTKVEDLRVNDILFLKPGDIVAVDGVIVDGETTVDESSITGESIPLYKTVNDELISSTINKTGAIKLKATRVGEDTTFNTIIKLVKEASNSKAPISKLADRVSLYFVPAIMVISIITFVIWLLVGKELSFAVEMAISVLVIACPCALGLATPVAIMVGIGMAAKCDMLIKSAESLETLSKVKNVLFDKTGTITKGKPSVVDIIDMNMDKKELLRIAYSLEQNTNHPFSLGIMQYAKDNDIKAYEVEEFVNLAGFGISGKIKNKNYYIGNIDYYARITKRSVDLDFFSKEAKTPVIVFDSEKILGILCFMDELKDNVSKMIKGLRKLNLKTYLLTGDNFVVAKAIGNQIGIDEVKANLKPEEKANTIDFIKNSGKAVMIGDGVNDAIALKKADVGMSISGATDVAIASSDIIIKSQDVLDIYHVIRLSKRVMNTIKMNLFWAFIYNLIGVVIATGILYYPLGLKLNPMIASLAMSFSSISVVLNALRINLFRKENKRMKEIVINIEGMMCDNCVKHVTEALKHVKGVKKVLVSREEKKATVKCNEEVLFEELEKAVVEKGYSVIK